MRSRSRSHKLAIGHRREPLRLVVEGVGDVVKNYYLPALMELKEESRRRLQITFVDKSEFWRDDPRLAEKMRQIIASVKEWGADYADKSEPEDLKKYQRLSPEVVIVATPDLAHVEVVGAWLKREPGPAQIFIEKPLAASLTEARRLLGLLQAYDNRVLAFDHYRARLLPTRTQMNVLLGFLGKGLRRLTFYFVEDHSGADPNHRGSGSLHRDGPIENEGRTQTLNQGVILDIMPHVIAILAHFCRVETLRVTRVRAGQYRGVDGDPDKRTEIEKETFAEVAFACADYGGNLVIGRAYVGKGIRGVKALGPEYDYNAKLFEVEGLSGRRARFDLRSAGQGSSRAYLINEKDEIEFEFALNSRPYRVFLEKVLDGTYLEDKLALQVEVAKKILEALEDMRHPIPARDAIPAYPSGLNGGRASLLLEEVCDSLPVLYGK